ncbi:hypothetical protein AUC68_03595 [Methyloceanibacter methanicus]|uniref:Porin domain-containing protein n=1 Tax=Methyloceanibacter methanicus TaxID=1774968 RepID=A0A1E3W4Y6_9HYPH|nr:hypothetical protein AUC68_03595 [Methyloceanibacter methanicus]
MGAALVGGLALPAQADELELSATTALTTDYVFRGISQTNQNPAIQGSLDAAYGIFYAGVWGSNITFADSLELDWYGGIASEWNGIGYDVGVIWYTYPGVSSTDYVEIKTGLSYGFTDNFTAGVTNYWSPDLKADALEAGAEYTFGTIMNFFDPSVSGLIGWQWFDAGGDYTYWNVGLTLGFMENWAVDVRYWDTDISDASCGAITGGPDDCSGRVVGTLSASF